MAKYIKRKTLIALIDDIDWYSEAYGKLYQGAPSKDTAYLKYNDVMDAIESVATVKMRGGKWIEEPDRRLHWHCSRCGYVIGMSGLESKYCPDCGAKMQNNMKWRMQNCGCFGGADNGQSERLDNHG